MSSDAHKLRHWNVENANEDEVDYETDIELRQELGTGGKSYISAIPFYMN